MKNFILNLIARRSDSGATGTIPAQCSPNGELLVALSDADLNVVGLYSSAWVAAFDPQQPTSRKFLNVISPQFTLDSQTPTPQLQVTHTNAGVPVTNADVVVGVASTQLVAANPTRRTLLLQNNGATDVSLNFGGAAVLGARMLLQAGTSVQFSGEACPSTTVTGISSANATVYVMET